ncbi:MAG TPA: ABC transporter permease [Vicinamibacterales bacterium]|nr:ABC transporter permease [Vicinamibacterales bacterium]
MKRSLRSWLWRVPIDQEVDEEIGFHIEMRARELVERGMDPHAAREVVLARLGDVSRLKRTCVDLGQRRDREMRLTQWLGELKDDVTFALRQLRGAPGFTLVAAITLALGIGANSAMFALADATLLRPFPFPAADRLTRVWERFESFPRITASWLNFRDWSERSQTFESMAGFFGYPRRIAAPDGTVEEIPAMQVTTRYFDVLGITPILGRTFVPSDVAFPPNTMVISEGLWRTRFGADPSVVGRTIQVDGGPVAILGVVSAEAQVVQRAGLWTLWAELPGMDARGLRFMSVIGRLKRGITVEAAQSEMTTLADTLARELPGTNKGRGITVEPLRTGLIPSEMRLTSLLFVGVVGFVLMMCCANVANLLLARASGRTREIAVRAALGAGRRRIVTQILTESLVLALIGGSLGLGVGALILRIAPSLIPQGVLPPAVTLSFDARVIVFCAATTFAIGLIFGLAPAWQASGTSLVQATSSESRGSTKGGARLRSVLVIAEVAAAVLLLCGAGLLLRTLMSLDNVDAGYRENNVITFRVNLEYGASTSRFPNEDALRRFVDAVEREVQRVPGVRSVGWTTGLPLDGNFSRMPFDIVGNEAAASTDRPLADYQLVTPTYLQTLDIPVVAGRGFSDQDSAMSVPVCLVSEGLVRRYLHTTNPIGMRIAIGRIQLGSSQPIVREIVGVVRQVKNQPTEVDDPAQVYVPFAQNAWSFVALAVRPRSGRADALVTAVRVAVARVDSGVPLTRIRTLDEVARDATARPRFRAVMVVTFAALALLLAMVGVFGVLAYTVEQRSREFGVRIALGATPWTVLGLVLNGAGRVIAVGVAVGLVVAAALGQAIGSFLFGVTPVDPLTFGAATLVSIITALVATAVPALRAVRVDPVVAFRSE